MSKPTEGPRRSRVERNIYKSPAGVFEVGFRDGAGVQRWRSVTGGLLAARRLRDELLAARAGGKRAPTDPRLRFGRAATAWLEGPVQGLRPTTQATYRCMVDQHLLPVFAVRRLDSIEPDDLVRLISDLRRHGKSEATITKVLGVVGLIYKYAARRLGWAGVTPTSLLLRSERPRASSGLRPRIFSVPELEQTVAAATEPFRTLFIVAAITGARLSELCGLVWADLDLKDVEDAEIDIGYQVDRKGVRVPTKTDGSARTIPIPRSAARLLVALKLASTFSESGDFVFCSRTGRALGQRNVARALRRAETRAVDPMGRPTFPILHRCDENGRKLTVPRASVPSMHSFRHTRASRALLAGESIDEVSFLLGHRDATVTRSVYLREVEDARRRATRKSEIENEFGNILVASPSCEASGGAR